MRRRQRLRGAAQVGELREGVAAAVVRARGRGAVLLQAPGWRGGDSAASRAVAARVIGEGGALRRAREEAAAAGKQWKPFGEIHLKVWSSSASHWIGFVRKRGCGLGK